MSPPVWVSVTYIAALGCLCALTLETHGDAKTAFAYIMAAVSSCWLLWRAWVWGGKRGRAS